MTETRSYLDDENPVISNREEIPKSLLPFARPTGYLVVNSPRAFSGRNLIDYNTQEESPPDLFLRLRGGMQIFLKIFMATSSPNLPCDFRDRCGDFPSRFSWIIAKTFPSYSARATRLRGTLMKVAPVSFARTASVLILKGKYDSTYLQPSRH